MATVSYETSAAATLAEELTPPQPPTKAELDAAEAGPRSAVAQRLRSEAARKPNDAHAVVVASIEALKLEQPALAYELSKEGTQRFPESAGLHRVQALAAYRLGRYEEAEAAVRQSLSLDNSQALSYFLLGSVCERRGDRASAARYRAEAARLDARYASQK